MDILKPQLCEACFKLNQTIQLQQMIVIMSSEQEMKSIA